MTMRQAYKIAVLGLGGEFFASLGNGCHDPDTIAQAAGQISDALIAEDKEASREA